MLVSTRRLRCSRSPPNCVVSIPEQNARSGAGQDDAADLAVAREAAERVRQLDPQVDRERVSLLGPPQGDEGDLVVALDRQETGHAATLSPPRPRVEPSAGQAAAAPALAFGVAPAAGWPSLSGLERRTVRGELRLETTAHEHSGIVIPCEDKSSSTVPESARSRPR